MLINLITIWKEGLLPDRVNENKVNKTKNTLVNECSFQFDTAPQVVFVRDMHTKNRTIYYGDLPTIILQPAEQKIYDETIKSIVWESKFL